MGRDALIAKRAAVILRIPVPLDYRLEAYAKEFGLSKNDIIEQALALWLNARDLEKQAVR